MGIFVEVNYKHVGMQNSKEQKKADEESLKIALKTLRKKCERSGLFREFRQHEFYEKPCLKRRRQATRKKANALRAQKEREKR